MIKLTLSGNRSEDVKNDWVVWEGGKIGREHKTQTADGASLEIDQRCRAETGGGKVRDVVRE